jgi:hypothetical protein
VNCRYVARDSPRIIPGRHTDDCPREDCNGCQPCEERHCRVCGVAHHEHACPDCMDETREAITEILRMCDALPGEAKAKGVNSEAMNLLGPAADWEQTNHVEASVLAGRLPADWIDHADHELHPLIVLGGWESVWREEFEAEGTKRQTVADAGAYLDRNLSRASSWPHVPFEDMARDLRRCRSHMEAVLHDGEQVDRGAPCPTCRTLLEKRWDVGQLGRDGWWCPKCKVIHTADQYDFRMKADYVEHAEWLNAVHIQQRFGVSQGTLRRWANGWKTFPAAGPVFHEPIVRKKPDGVETRNLYSVADVKAALSVDQESA